MSVNSRQISFFLTGLFAGGGERVVLDLARGFADEGYDVDIVLVEKRGTYVDEVPENVNLVVLEGGRLLTAFPRLTSYLRRKRPRALLTTSEHAHVLALFAKKLARVDTRVVIRLGIAYSRVIRRYRRMRDKMIPYLLRMALRWADAIVAVSYGVAYDCHEVLNIPSRRITVIYSPKDISDIRARSEEPTGHPWLDEKDAPVVLGVGRFHEQKDFRTLIDAFSGLNEKWGARLIILGDGKERKHLEECVRTCSLEDDVSCPGFVDNPYAYMAKSDVFVLSSRWEGLPNALIEAHICRLPVIATDCPYGPREILAPKTDITRRITDEVEYAEYGVLVPVGDERRLAQALSEMLGSEEIRNQYSMLSAERARDFAREVVFDHYKFIFGLQE